MRIERITASGLPPFQDLDLKLPEPERSPDGPRLGEVHLITGPNGTGKSRLLSGIVACAGYTKPLGDRVGKVKTGMKLEVLGLPVEANGDLIGMFLERAGSKIKEILAPKLDLPLSAPDAAFQAKWIERQASARSASVTSVGDFMLNLSVIESAIPIYARSPSAWLTHTPVTFLQSVPAPKDSDRLGFTPDAGRSRDLLQTIANVKARSLNDFQKHMGRPGAKRSKMEELIGTIEAELSDFFGVHVFFRTDAETSSLLVDFGAVEEMTMSQAPDGLRSVIGWLVDVIMMTHLLRPESANPMHEEMVVLLDEPETHLHPGWQRKIIPLAQKMLPNAQIIVATHSPFVVMSVNEGWIHRLEPQEDGTVKAVDSRKASKGDSYVWVMREIMKIPERFDPESEKIMADFREAKEKALDGEKAAEGQARELLGKLALRGEELSWIARAELQQLEEELSEPLPQ